MTKQLLAATVLAACLPTLGVVDDLNGRPILTYDAAGRIIAACFAAQAAAGDAKVNVVVVDDGGRLIDAGRQDAACKACTDIAQNKAVTSLLYALPARAIVDLTFAVKRDSVNVAAAFVPGPVAFAGGLPIKTAAGAVIGGIGVSSASEDQDEAAPKRASTQYRRA